MSWVRLDVDTPIDERLFGSGFALFWPAVLTRAKKSGGHISRLASSPKQLAALWGSTVEDSTVTRPLRPEAEAVTTYIQTGHTDTTGQTSSSSSPPPSRTPEEDDDLRTVVDGWLSTQLTNRGHIRTQATGHELEALRRTLGTHGREKTLAAIRAAANTAETGSPKLSLLLAIAERGVYEGPPPERRKPERSGGTSTTSKKQQLADADDYWAEGREASRRLGGRRVTHVPGVGYIATEELTAEHIAAVEAAGFAVI